MPRTYSVDFECHKNARSRGLFSSIPSHSTIKISRMFPHILNHNDPNVPNFTEHNWTEFCDEIDEILVAFNATRRKISVSACYLSATFFLSLVILLVLYLLKWMGTTFFGAINTIFIFFLLFGSCFLSSRSSENNVFVMNGLGKVCRKASLRYRGIDFSPSFDRCHGTSTRPIKCIFIKTGPGLRLRNDDDTVPCSFSDSSYDDMSERSSTFEEYEFNDEESYAL